MAFRDYSLPDEQLCSGTITYPCGTDSEGNQLTCTGSILFGCGTQHDTKIAGSAELQLPFKYHILRERARLATCCWWRPDPSELDPLSPNNSNTNPEIYEFIPLTVNSGILSNINVVKKNTDGSETLETIPNPDLTAVGGWKHESIPSFIINPRDFKVLPYPGGAPTIPTKCRNTKATIWNQGQDDSFPCNGAKTDCPYYSGPKFQYLNDEAFGIGRGVLAQSIQELRSLSEDWKKYGSLAQDVWEQSYDLPYIWGRDIDDVPTAITTSRSDIGENIVYTILTQVYWEVLNEKANLVKVPSADSSTEASQTLGLTPPNFPTIIRELGVSTKPNLKITFPPRKGKTSKDIFLYESFLKNGEHLYIAGTAVATTNIYAINQTVTNFPDLNTVTNLTNDEITELVKIEYKKNYVTNSKYFLNSTSDVASFWHFIEGIKLKPGLNTILILAQIGGTWNFQSFPVNFYFHHIEILQEGYTGTIPAPVTDTLISSLSSINPKNAIKFNFLPIAGDVIGNSAYHFYIFDRSNSRAISENEDNNLPPNKRYWTVDKESTSVTLNNTNNSNRWYKFDKCSRLLLQIDNPIIPSCKPMYLDRSWEPRNIVLQADDGQGSTKKITLKVVEEFGRNLDGIRLPINYLIVEPENDMPIPETEETLNAVITLDVEIFKARNVNAQNEGKLTELIEEFGITGAYTALGTDLTTPSEDDLEDISPHSISIQNTFLNASTPPKFDMSYVVEFKSNITGRVIGKKWVYGIAEQAKTWARDLEIYYSWSANQKFRTVKHDLYKHISRIIPPYLVTPYERLSSFAEGFAQANYTAYRPDCGDHEITYGKPGPMFSPYEDCEQSYIREEDLGISLIFRIPYTNGTTDERYRGPEKLSPRIYKHNVLGSIDGNCYFEFSLGHFERTEANWAGYGRIRGPITPFLNPFKYGAYLLNDWTFPQFGNTGREQYRSQLVGRFVEYIYITSAGPKVSAGWMPINPHITTDSLFDETKPRCILYQTVYSNQAKEIYRKDEKYSSAVDILNNFSAGETPAFGFIQDSEVFNYERKNFDDIFTVKKIRTKEGKGTRYPDIGFYFNFKNRGVAWAYPEQEKDISRQLDLFSTDVLSQNSFFGGLVFSRIPLTSGIRPIERFSRPVYIGLPEKEYNLKIEEAKYSVSGYTSEYAKVYLDTNYPVYFDRFTGEIQDFKSNDPNVLPNISKELYACDSKNEIEDFFDKKFNLNPNEITLNHLFSSNEDSPNTLTFDLIDDFIKEGNLFTSLLSDNLIRFYQTAGLEGPLDDEEMENIAIFPGAKIERINTKFLSKKELLLDQQSNNFENVDPLIKFSRYFSGPSPAVKEELSNKNIPNLELNFINVPLANLKWDFLSNSDNLIGPPASGQVDQRNGYVEPVTVEITLNYPVEASYLALQYNVEGHSTATGNLPAPPQKDPSVKITVYDQDNNPTVFIEKPEFLLKKYSVNNLSRALIFKYETPTNSGDEDLITEGLGSIINKTILDDSFNIKRIVIQIGRRFPTDSFSLSRLSIKALVLNDNINEKILQLEPKYIITTGRANSNENSSIYRWAQDPDRLLGTVTTTDMADQLEAAGIAEFWKPMDFDVNEVFTIGKLRKHWANKFKSYDADKYFRDLDTADNTIVTSTVEETESYQVDLIKNFLDNLQVSWPQLVEQDFKYFILPDDKTYLNLLGFSDFFSNEDSIIKFKMELPVIGRDNIIAPTSLSPGWQDIGYAACIKPEFTTAGCIDFLGRAPYLAYANDQSTCRGGEGGAGGEVFRLFDLGMLDREEQMGVADPNSALAQTESPKSFDAINFDNAQREALVTRIEKYRREKDRYNP